MNSLFIAAVINSTFRYSTPLMFAALGSLFCTRCGVFNVALEGQMLAASFAAIVMNYYTQNVLLSVLAGLAAGVFVSLIVAIFQIKLGVRDMVVGTSVNLLVQSLTSFLMQIIFGTRGTIQGNGMLALPKFSFRIGNFAFFNRMFESLSILDYLAYVIAFLLFIYLFKTVSGFHLRSVGINRIAAQSLGIRSQRIEFNSVLVSGALCALGGIAQCMGMVTVFVENMTAGRGFIAMGAASMAQAHPLMAILSSLFFGASISLSKTLQTTINAYFTEAFPYFCTILAITLFGIIVSFRVRSAKRPKRSIQGDNYAI
ncbi:MAG: ABC transporter permease [Sphaerochaetaceae bacterium]